MDKRWRALPALALLAASSVLHAEAPQTGRQVPPMPQLVDEGKGGWISAGGSPWGVGAVFSRQGRRVVGNFVGGLFGMDEEHSGGILGITVDWPLSSGSFFAGLGGGPGLMFVSLDPHNKAFLCLNVDFQVFFRFSSRLGFGVYTIVGVSGQRTAAGILFCLQYGRWKI